MSHWLKLTLSLNIQKLIVELDAKSVVDLLGSSNKFYLLLLQVNFWQICEKLFIHLIVLYT